MTSSVNPKGSRVILRGHVMLTSEQIRGARALLKMKQTELADLSGVPQPTLKRWEAGSGIPKADAGALRRLFERKGIEFIEENGGGVGVRLKKK